MKKREFFALALLAAVFVSLSPQAKAQDYSSIRIVRLSFVEGTVQYQRPGQDWQDAALNLPLQEGFALRTTDGYAEVEFEDSLAMRLGTDSTVEFAVLALQDGGRITGLAVPQGTAIITAKLRRGDAVSVSSGNLNLKVPHGAKFRVDASPTEDWVTVFRGKIEADSGTGTSSLVSGGHTLRQNASGAASPEIAGNPAEDAFDKWVSHREDAVNSAQGETSSIIGTRSYTEGFADLYNYGDWSYLPGYGAAWMPYGAGAGWMPFVNGQWQFMGGTGWNWISAEPWGWFPYHFGSWVNAPGVGWAWLPVGAAGWLPATASWIRVNNQLGWIPNGPPLSSKPTKAQQAAVPSTLILASQAARSGIKAGDRLPLVQAGGNVRAAAAPSPSFAAPAPSSTQSVARTNESAMLNRSAPAVLRAPRASAAQMRVAQLSSIPRAVMAPRSMAAPAIARGVSGRGFGGSSRARGAAPGAGMTGVISASPGTSTAASPSGSGHTSTAGAAHAGGTASSAGHR
jgi:hypothetical protein